jgi:hypothetical protein
VVREGLTASDRLMARASFAQVIEEAQPYFALFPLEKKPRLATGAAGAKNVMEVTWNAHDRFDR